jgi:hypothetical protein
LGNVVGAIATVLNQQRENVVVFVTGVSRIELREIVEDDAPCFDFFFCVFDVRELKVRKMKFYCSMTCGNVLSLMKCGGICMSCGMQIEGKMHF